MLSKMVSMKMGLLIIRSECFKSCYIFSNVPFVVCDGGLKVFFFIGERFFAFLLGMPCLCLKVETGSVFKLYIICRHV